MAQRVSDVGQIQLIEQAQLPNAQVGRARRRSEHLPIGVRFRGICRRCVSARGYRIDVDPRRSVSLPDVVPCPVGLRRLVAAAVYQIVDIVDFAKLERRGRASDARRQTPICLALFARLPIDDPGKRITRTVKRHHRRALRRTGDVHLAFEIDERCRVGRAGHRFNQVAHVTLLGKPVVRCAVHSGVERSE